LSENAVVCKGTCFILLMKGILNQYVTKSFTAVCFCVQLLAVNKISSVWQNLLCCKLRWLMLFVFLYL